MTQRDVFFQKLKKIRNTNNKIVIITCDMGANSLNSIKNESWYINVGASEQLAICMATGLALKDYKPYVYMIGSFVTRAFEQIHLMASMNLPVTIVSVGAGLSYDMAGVTHHAINDLNSLRTIPNMTIVNISSIEMSEYYSQKSLEYETPVYIRLDKLPIMSEKAICDSGWQVLKHENNRNLIISTGVISHLVQNNIKNADVIEVNEFPCNEYDLLKFINNTTYENIYSIEENYMVGGLGDYLYSLGIHVNKIALNDFCESKSRNAYFNFLFKKIGEMVE